MDRKLKAAIIGCGGIAGQKHMPALAKLADKVEMTAFCDILPERAEKAAKEFGVPGARVFASHKALLAEAGPSLDLAHVCTPNKSHAEITVDSLEAGLHVMCEKPMAKTAADARRMAEAARRTGKKLTIGYQSRHRADSRYLKKLVESGALGEIYFAKAHALRRRAVPTWGVFLNEEEQGGGPLIDISTHALDLTLWTMGNHEPAYVMGTIYRKLADQRDTGNAFGEWDPAEFTVEDSAFGFVVMKNGATIILESSWALNTLDTGEAQTTLCGTLAGADMKKGLRINRVEQGVQTTVLPETNAGGVDFFMGETKSPADLEASLWIDAILNGTDVVVKPEEALVVTEILEAIYASARTGQPVYFK